MTCAYCGDAIAPDDLSWINGRRWHTSCWESVEAARYDTYVGELADG